MKNINEVREAMLRGKLKKMERNLEAVTTSINKCEEIIDRIVKDIKDVNDEELVDTIKFALKTINLGETNKSKLEADIAYINNELQNENKVQELLREKLELSKKEENRLREKFYLGEYDSKLVNDMNKMSKQIKDLELLINSKPISTDTDFEGDILAVHKMNCDKPSTDKENDEDMIVTLPSSGIKVNLSEIDKDELKRGLDTLSREVLTSKYSENVNIIDEILKVFGDKINILGLNNIKSIIDTKREGIFDEPLRQHLYSTKHLLNVDENPLLKWFNDTIQKKEEQDEIRKQNPKNHANENALNSLINNDNKNLLSSYHLQEKGKRHIEDKFSEIPRMFNGYENKIGTYSRDIQTGKSNEDVVNKSIDELEDEIMRKVMEKVPEILAEETQKVLNKINK